MELTINIKEQKDIETFLNLIKDIDYLEIVGVKEDDLDVPIEHRDLLAKRLERIESGETKFKNWNLIKRKYEEKII
jgi:hypothetical protein